MYEELSRSVLLLFVFVYFLLLKKHISCGNLTPKAIGCHGDQVA